jgi:hypothetical protein
MPPQPPALLQRRWLTPEACCALLALVVFFISLSADYIYDDLARIIQDERVRSPSQMPKLLTGEYNGDGQDNLYRPLTSLTYAVQYWIHGTVGWPYHLVNILLHAWVTILVCRLARCLASPASATWTAWIAGVAFAVHPIHAEPVIAIVGRAELICALGYLGSILLLMPVARDRMPLSVRRAGGIVACAAVALLAKEHGLVLPLILLLMWGLRQPVPVVAAPQTFSEPDQSVAADRTLAYAPKPKRRASLPNSWAVLLVGISSSIALYIIAREQWLGLRLWWERSFLDWSIQPLIRADSLHRWLVPFEIIGHYLELLIAPRRLAMDYGAAVIMPKADLAGPYFWMGVAATLAYLGLTALAVIRRHRPQVWLLLGFGITYGVISNIPTIIGTPMGERLLYIPTIFLFTSLAVWLANLPHRRWGVVVLVVVGALWSLRSFDYARRWHNADQYYAYQLTVQPKSIRIHLAAGLSAMEMGDLPRAAAIAAAARQTLPEYWDAWVMSGKIALRQQKYDDAIGFMQEAYERWPSIYTQRQLADAYVARNLAATRPSPTTLPGSQP